MEKEMNVEDYVNSDSVNNARLEFTTELEKLSRWAAEDFGVNMDRKITVELGVSLMNISSLVMSFVALSTKNPIETVKVFTRILNLRLLTEVGGAMKSVGNKGP